MKKFALLILAASLATFASAQKTYLLRVRLKTNEVFKYAVDVETMGFTMNMTMQQKVIGVSGNKFTVNTTMGAMKMNGKPMPEAATKQIRQMLVTTVTDDRGRVISTKTTGLPNMSSGAQNATVPFPAAAIAIGQKWSGKANINGTEVQTDYKLAGVKSMGGVQVAVIESVPKGVPGMKLSGPIVLTIDLKKGIPVTMSMNGSMTGPQGTQTMKMSMRRI